MGRLAKDRVINALHSRGEKVILATVSGIATTTADMLSWADRELVSVSMLTTKSFQVIPNPGNREPVIAEIETGSYINSVGLRNPGMDAALKELQSILPLRALLNVSLSASNPEDFITLAKAFAQAADLLELNFSCPHAAEGYGSSIGGTPEIAARYMRAIRDALGEDFPVPIIPKLTPNTDDIGRVARAVMDEGADGIAAVNTAGPELYLEPHSSSPILQNSLGGRGGRSGRWIRSLALEAVASVRKAVGPDVLILGMGGINSGEDAYRLAAAGADTVGIGSVLGTVRQQDWKAFTEAVQKEAESLLQGKRPSLTAASTSFISSKRTMEYMPFTVQANTSHGEMIRVITCEGKMDYDAGQFVFLWIPGTGEKPFSIACADPLTFVVKDRGPFTSRLCSVRPGEVIYLRGLYGNAAELTDKPKCLLMAGGTGIAVLSALCDSLARKGAYLETWYGTTGDEAAAPLQDLLERYGPVKTVPDLGEPGRVIGHACAARHGEDPAAWAWYIVGPQLFMEAAAQAAMDMGISEDSIYLSLEQTSLCGTGLCGTCSVGGRLTCQYGTFMRYSVIRSRRTEETL